MIIFIILHYFLFSNSLRPNSNFENKTRNKGCRNFVVRCRLFFLIDHNRIKLTKSGVIYCILSFVLVQNEVKLSLRYLYRVLKYKLVFCFAIVYGSNFFGNTRDVLILHMPQNTRQLNNNINAMKRIFTLLQSTSDYVREN